MRIVDVVEITKPIASPIRNAYIDFSKMTASLVAIVTNVLSPGLRDEDYAGQNVGGTVIPSGGRIPAGALGSDSPRLVIHYASKLDALRVQGWVSVWSSSVRHKYQLGLDRILCEARL